MKKAEIVHMPEYFDRYINLVDDIDLPEALARYGTGYWQNEYDQLCRLGDHVYAPGKWTVKDILQHILDAERVFAYRAMRIARADTTPLPGFDENTYAAHSRAGGRSLDDLLAEFDAIRRATILLFKSFDDEMLQRTGTASGKTISPVAIGFTIAGHVVHHMNVLKERYYPLLRS